MSTYVKKMAIGVAVAAIACLLALPALAAAAVPPDLWQVPEDGKEGVQAGQFGAVSGIATDPASGHVFVADSVNRRIDEFTAWGEFLDAWGGGVVPGGAAGIGNLSAGSAKVTSLVQTSKNFEVGQPVEGTGIPAGTTIADIGVQTLTLSQPATASGTAVALTSPVGAGNLPVNERQLVTVGGSPSGGSFTLALTTAETVASFTAGSNLLTGAHNGQRPDGFHIGDVVHAGEVFPPGTTVSAIGEDSLTLSAPASATVNAKLVPVTGIEKTPPIPLNSSAAEIQAALAALPAVGGGNVSVSGVAEGSYEIEFKGPLLADVDLAPLSSDASGLTPAGTVNVFTIQDGGGALELCTDLCRAGVEGAGAGQFDAGPFGIAVDSAGNVYAGDPRNNRVQKFSPDGDFIYMLGGGVDKGPNNPGNICTVADLLGGDTCGAGSKGAGSGEFDLGDGGSVVLLAVGYADTFYVSGSTRVQKFTPAGAPLGEFSLETSPIGLAVAPDAGGDILYATLLGKNDVRKLNAAGAQMGTLPLEVLNVGGDNTRRQSPPLAVDAFDHVYSVFDPTGYGTEGKEEEVVEWAADGTVLLGPGSLFGAPPPSGAAGFLDRQFINKLGTSAVGTNGGIDVYASYRGGDHLVYLRAFGPPPDQAKYGPPPSRPPAITDTFATSVSSADATVRAKINPLFWTDATYRVQYGTAPCSQGGCAETATSSLTDKAIGSPLTVATLLSGLQPDTTYHFRFVAQSGGGGPAFGPEATFHTFPAPTGPDTNCPNQAYRGGFGANLPDCRAYELVSPLEKNNGDIYPFGRGAFFQAAIDGDGLAYPSLTAFAGPDSAPLSSRYLARRGTDGWTSRQVSPPREITIPAAGGFPVLADPFKAFSPDLSQAWLLHESTSILAPGAVPDYANLYRRDNLADSYEALTKVKPPHREPKTYYPEFQGVSADGTHVVFRVPDSLTANAPNLGPDKTVLYEVVSGKLRLVSLLPNGNATTSSASAGMDNGDRNGQAETVDRAISSDGSTIYWSAAAAGGDGTLYVRVGGTKTYPVSETVSGQPARFWTASTDGARAFFTIGGTLTGEGSDLYEYDLAGKSSSFVAHQVNGVLGASPDGSLLYFVSREALAGSGQNSQGDEAQAGQPNLYLRHAGSIVFIGTLSREDIGNQPTFSPVAAWPKYRTSRVSPDGRHIAFMSKAPLTGYDNLDQETGKPLPEVYRYSAPEDQLDCVSCNPTGVRPRGRDVEGFGRLLAGRIPVWPTQNYASRVLSDDGSRLFFESFEALVPRDTNGRGDVYEWEQVGAGGCSEQAPEFSPGAGGCVALISSGKGSADTEFLDASPDGKDVFLLTASSLVPQDYGLIDVYDARVEGGFPAPGSPPAACEGEACQGLPSPPNDPTPASSSFQGAGNLTGKPSPKPCRQGKVRRKGRCVAKHKHRHHKHKPQHGNHRTSDQRTGR